MVCCGFFKSIAMSKDTHVISKKIQIIPVDKQDYKKLHNIIYHGAKLMNEIYRHRIFITELTKKDSPYIKSVEFVHKSLKGNTNEIAKTYKDRVMSCVYDACNTKANNDFENDFKDMYGMKRSARTYKLTAAIPFRASGLRKKKDELFFAGIGIKPIFGKATNGIIQYWDSVFDGRFKMADSTIQYCKRKNKFYINLVSHVPIAKPELNPKKSITISCSEYAIVEIDYGGKRNYIIGDQKGFLHKRLGMRHAKRELRAAMRYNKGGKGRKKKVDNLKTLNNDKEKRWVDTYLHTISKMVVDYCIKFKVGNVEFLDIEFNVEDEKIKKLMITSLSSYALKSKISSKLKAYGIVIVDSKSAKAA